MRAYGLGKGTVLRLLDRHSVARRRQGLKPTEVQEIVQLYGQRVVNGPNRGIFGKHHSVIVRALERAGVPRRDSHGRQRP
jgi:hypothetical protein